MDIVKIISIWLMILVIVGFYLLNFGSPGNKKQIKKLINDYWWIILIIVSLLCLDKSIGGGTKFIYKVGSYYIYIYKHKKDYDKYLEIINVFKKYNFMPKVVFNKGLIVVVEDTGRTLNEYAENHNTLKGFQQKINFIRDTFEKHNFIHNDLNQSNIMIKNGNIYIIDIDQSFFEENSQRTHNKNCCPILPKAKNGNIINYIKDNPCIQCSFGGNLFQVKNTVQNYLKKITLILCILVILRVKKII